jgi:hypothetical protein
MVECGRFWLEEKGSLVRVSSDCGGDTLKLVFLRQNNVPFGSCATFESIVSADADGDIQFASCAGDSIPYAILSAYSSFSPPDFAITHLVSGEEFVAKLTETHEHCMGHMENTLRIYNAAGKSIWKAETGLYGAMGVWARDLDRDGVDELLVLADDHGARRLIVFERSE